MSQNYQRMYNEKTPNEATSTPLATAPPYTQAPDYSVSPKDPYHQPQYPYQQPQNPYPQPQTNFTQPRAYTTQEHVYTTQPEATNTTMVVSHPATYQERPSHALSIGSLIFAVVTLILSGGSSAFCTIPAIILSSVALAQDYRAGQARTLSIASLVFTAVFYVCAIIVAIVMVIMVVSAEAATVNNIDIESSHYYYGHY